MCVFGRCELVGHVFEIWGGGEWKPKEGSRARCKWKSSKEAGSNLNNTQIKNRTFSTSTNSAHVEHIQPINISYSHLGELSVRSDPKGHKVIDVSKEGAHPYH